jgi:hypothetical protein
MRYSEQELIEDLHRLTDELGEPPTLQEYREYGEHSATTYYERFGSWREALAAAGYGPREPTDELPVEDLLEELQRLDDIVDDTPSAADMDEHGEYWASTYRRRFDSWNNALERAGLEPTPESTSIPEDELVAELQRLADELGERPSFTQMTDHGKFGATTYTRHFGSWNAALDVAFDENGDS